MKKYVVLLLIVATVFAGLSPPVTAVEPLDVDTYYFNNYMWNQRWEDDWWKITDNNSITYGYTSIEGDKHRCISHSGENESGWGDITKVEIRAKLQLWGRNSSSLPYVNICPKFLVGGNFGDNRSCSLPAFPTWTNWFDITNDTNAPANWTDNDFKGLDVLLTAESLSGNQARCYKIEVRVTH